MDKRADKPVEPRRGDEGLEGWARIIARMGTQHAPNPAKLVDAILETLSTVPSDALFRLLNHVEGELQSRDEYGRNCTVADLSEQGFTG
jgi:hypothetical protein